MKFEEKMINDTVNKLLNGEDYRLGVVNAVNAKFFDFTIDFFKAIVEKKLNNESISVDWYKSCFITDKEISQAERNIYCCLNKKTVENIVGKVGKGNNKKQILFDLTIKNYTYLKSMVDQLENDTNNDLNIEIKITRNGVSVELSLSESLIVINALACKKLAINGGAYSAIGKAIEKPLLIELCKKCNVDPNYYDASQFVKDKSKPVDREVDFKLKDSNEYVYYCEVKLMGKGNPESADVVIARDSKVFIADTLSEQNKNQLNERKVLWLELNNHKHEDILKQFKTIISELKIPVLSNKN